VIIAASQLTAMTPEEGKFAAPFASLAVTFF
jgi:hypothetical protein